MSMDEIVVRDRHIEALEARIVELEEALTEERAKQLNVDEPCPGRTSYEHCKILDDVCDGYPSMWAVCPRKKEKLSAAKDELHSEGKI